MERLKQLSSHLSLNQTFSVVEDARVNDVGLDGASLFSMKGKVCVVTGGSRGIGKMITAAYMANGAKVFITSRKAAVVASTVEELNKKYQSNGGKCVGFPGDLSTFEGVEAFYKKLSASTDKIHVLVNNAGATWGGNLGEYPDSAWDKCMDLNVRHVFNLTQFCLPLLKNGTTEAESARVIIIASVEGMRVTLTKSPLASYAYTSSKAAAIHLTKSLARSFTQHDYKISVNCICPGVFPSNMSKELVKTDFYTENPMKRYGKTADMAAAALYLAGPGGGFTNGAIIPIDGGSFLVN